MSQAPHEVDPLFFNRYRDNRGLEDLAPFFNNQDKLWAKHGASGTNPLKRHGANVLTMRLLLAQDALGQLKDYQLKIAQKTGQYIADTSMVASGVTRPVLSPDPSTGNSGEVITLDTIRAYEYHYSFLSSLVSTLDWLANEINAIYGLGIDSQKIDWKYLVAKSALLSAHNPPLKALIDTLSIDPRITRLFDCRNVCEHQGSVKIEDVHIVDGSVKIDHEYKLTVADDPRDPNSPAHTFLIDDCKKMFFAVVEECCDAAYSLMI